MMMWIELGGRVEDKRFYHRGHGEHRVGL